MESLAVYIPMDRRQALARGEDLPDRTNGAALFADISGFTALTEALTRELGPRRGAEELTRQLNRVYGTLIAEVHRYSGSVIGFSGDAITCWLDKDNGRRATACALALQGVLLQLEAAPTSSGRLIPLGIKVAVAAGPARRFLAGHPHIQLIDVLAGVILDRIAAAEGQLREGEVVVGAEVMAWLGNQARVQEWRADPSGEHFAVVTGLAEPVPSAPWPEMAPLDEVTARKWILPPVYQRLQRGEGEFLAELRPAVPLFVKFSGIDYDRDDEAGAKLDTYIRWVQSALARYEGYLVQFTIGDKGCYMYGVFGAPLAHEDDPARAVAAALELQSPPSELSFVRNVQISISHGQMRAGAYGGPTRRTYGVLGTEVNVAARLMDQAQPGQILVTPAIKKAVAGGYDFHELGPVSLKGVTEPLPVFAVRARRTRQAASHQGDRGAAPLVGRKVERGVLSDRLQALLDGQSGTIIIEGAAGIGKSRLVADMLEQAHALAIPRLVGAGDAIEGSTAYYAWRPIFREIFGLGENADGAETRRRVLAQLEDSPQLLERAPLLNAVLPLNLPDNDLTAQMTGEVRADNTRDLLIHVLERLQRSVSVLILVIEDAHWMDSASWALTLDASHRVAPLLVVVATRPVADPIPDEYDQLLSAPGALHVELERLPSEDTLALVRQRLGVTELPPQVAQLIHEKAEGHPFFSEEMAYSLRESGLIIITNGTCRIAPDTGDLRALDLPDTVQGVIASRIDRLTPSEQLTLKVASVIGRIFPFHTLRDVYPVDADRPYLRDCLDTLERLDITPLEMPEPNLAYVFKHVITQDVAYNMLLFAQRRALHRATAEWYERTFGEDLSPFYPTLAHHWSRAEVIPKAIEHLDKAADQALDNFANEEAVAFLGQALALHAQAATAGDQPRRALWELKLGEAYVNLSKYLEGQVHLEAGLALLGQPVPATTASQVIQLLRQVLRQATHRIWPARYLGRSSEQRETLLAASRAYERLTEVYYYADETLLSLYAAFLTLNTAEAAGQSPELARGYATLGALTGFIPFHRAAQAYLRRALRVVHEVDDQSARTWVTLVAGHYFTGVGDWTTARDHYEAIIETSEHLGDRRRWQDAVSELMAVHYFQGDFSSGGEAADDLYQSGKRSDAPRFQAIGLQGKILCLLGLGRMDEVISTLRELQSLLAEDTGEIALERLRIEMHGLRSIAHLHRAEHQEALQAAEQAAELAAKSRPSDFSAFSGYANPAEIYLALWEAGYPEPGIQESARKACKILRGYAGVFPIGQPRHWLWQGLYEWLSGKPAKAREAWQKSLAAAEQLGMRYDEGLAHYETGRHLAYTDPARIEHLTHAVDIFTELEAAYDLERAQAASTSKAENLD